MAKSIAVLDWKDVQKLLGMCSHAFDRNDPNFEVLENGRRHLIDNFLSYLHEWLPGKEIDDETRRPLIASLESFSGALRKTMISDLESASGVSPSQEMYRECLQIKRRLQAALAPDDSPQGGPAVLEA
jgi:hypothetical protein